MAKALTVKKQTRIFDIQKEGNRISQALKKLQETQRPGEGSGTGSKTEVLISKESEIRLLVDKGFTIKQIAAAISNCDFRILPKSITQLLNRPVNQKTDEVKYGAHTRVTEPGPAPVDPDAQTGSKPVAQIKVTQYPVKRTKVVSPMI